MKIRLFVVIGTRPEAVKLAPLVQACERRPDAIVATVCLSGQHRDLVEGILRYFNVPVDVTLKSWPSDVSDADSRLSDLTASCLRQMDRALLSHNPDYVVAQGDTTTVLATSMAAFYRRIPLVHVEAGLRTGDLDAPWPEEFNRRVAGLAATLHCAPTQRAAENLKAEGVPPESIHVTGNTVVDALQWTRRRERARADFWRRKHDYVRDRRLVLITAHRRENLASGLRGICEAVGTLATRFPDVAFAFPVHPNPDVKELVYGLLRDRPNVHLLPPLAYPEFVWLMDRASAILSDSGGVQEEAVSLGKPLLVARDKTERPEAIEQNATRLVGTSPARLVREMSDLLTCRQEQPAQTTSNPFGDGRAAERIVDVVLADASRRGKNRLERNCLSRRVESRRRSDLIGVGEPVEGQEARRANPGSVLRR